MSGKVDGVASLVFIIICPKMSGNSDIRNRNIRKVTDNQKYFRIRNRILNR